MTPWLVFKYVLAAAAAWALVPVLIIVGFLTFAFLVFLLSEFFK